MANHHPPKFYERLLKWFCDPIFYEELEGDLWEHFHYDLEKQGVKYARRRYRKEVIKLFRPSVIKHFSFNIFKITPAMLKNYLKISFRNLWKHKDSSIINILGLTIGLAGCLLIGLFVNDEYKYDRFHPNLNQLYRIYADISGDRGESLAARSSPMIGPSFKEEFPEVIDYFRLFPMYQKLLFKHEQKEFLEKEGFFADPEMLNFFHLPFKYGDPNTALTKPGTIVLSEELAEKYFGAENPTGKSLSISGNATEVVGVLEKTSPHFHLDFEFLIPMADLLRMVPTERMQSWIWQDFATYFKLQPEVKLKALEQKIEQFAKAKIHPRTQEFNFKYTPKLQKVTDIRLYSADFRNDLAQRGNYLYINGLIGISIFLLLIACINFINLTTAKAIRRAKEVGVRKASGALKSQLAFQFIVETAVMVSIAGTIALFITLLLLPQVNNFADKDISLLDYLQPIYIISGLAFVLLVSLLAGAYPAFILSNFKPVDAFKSSAVSTSNHSGWLRNGLVVVQFGLSILLIISVLIVSQQVNYLSKKDLGFNKEQLVHFPIRGKIFDMTEQVKEELLRIPEIKAATRCYGIPGDIVSGDLITIKEGETRTEGVRLFNVDHDYISTLQLEVIAGRDFSKEIKTDSSEGFIINEAAVKQYNLGDSPEEAIGKKLEWSMWDHNGEVKKGQVIGVVKDFHYASLHEPITASILHIYPSSAMKLVLRLNSNDMGQTIEDIEKVWDRYQTGYPLDYQFVDERLAVLYKSEQDWNKLLWLGTFLAIFIACVGAIGLALYAIENRRKEIGIRKVLGASVTNIVGLISKDFLLLIFIALIIASPITWYFMDNWLDNFAYRIPIYWWVFPLAGAITILLGLLTVGSQGLLAAIRSPIKSLRSE